MTPSAAKDEIAGLWEVADGEHRLAVKVTAPPDKGKANAAVIKLLSKQLKLPKSVFAITAGETARLKTLAVTGDQKELSAALNKLPV